VRLGEAGGVGGDVSDGPAPADHDDHGRPAHVWAPAKLTLSLRVTGRRDDGLHELVSEMVTLDLADELEIDPGGDGMTVEWDLSGSVSPRPGEGGRPPVPVGEDNLVRRALRAVDRTARVRVVKRIPVGGGLGGGSADAAAILRWAGCRDLALALSLGSDVPFCVLGGRATVGGVGQRVDPAPFEPRSFVLLVPPLGVPTGPVYREWDASPGARVGARPGTADLEGNDLTEPALRVEPRLSRWRDVLRDLSGREPRLAGSGATWFVEGSRRELGIDDRDWVEEPDGRARLVEARTVPAGWAPRRRVGPAS
jgi:4-diphosphocytidyl-2-C-methyl-D-erythritol kinase